MEKAVVSAAGTSGTATHEDPALWGPAAWDTLANLSNGLSRSLPKDSQSIVQIFLLSFMSLLPCDVCARDATNLFLLRPLTDEEAANERNEIPRYLLRFRNTVSLKIGRPLLSYNAYMRKYGVDLRSSPRTDPREAPTFNTSLLVKLQESAETRTSSGVARRFPSHLRGQTPRRRYIRRTVDRLSAPPTSVSSPRETTSLASSRWDDEKVTHQMRQYRQQQQLGERPGRTQEQGRATPPRVSFSQTPRLPTRGTQRTGAPSRSVPVRIVYSSSKRLH